MMNPLITLSINSMMNATIFYDDFHHAFHDDFNDDCHDHFHMIAMLI